MYYRECYEVQSALITDLVFPAHVILSFENQDTYVSLKTFYMISTSLAHAIAHPEDLR